MMFTFAIYVLIDPRNDELFYVGQTSSGAERLNSHVACAVTGVRSGNASDTHRRIYDILESGNRLTLLSIEECSSREIVKSRETMWMSAYQQMGYRLTNTQKADHYVECDAYSLVKSVIYLPVLGNWEWWIVMELHDNYPAPMKIHRCNVPPLLSKGVIKQSGDQWVLSDLGRQLVNRRLNCEKFLNCA